MSEAVPALAEQAWPSQPASGLAKCYTERPSRTCTRHPFQSICKATKAHAQQPRLITLSINAMELIINAPAAWSMQRNYGRNEWELIVNAEIDNQRNGIHNHCTRHTVSTGTLKGLNGQCMGTHVQCRGANECTEPIATALVVELTSGC